MITKCPHCNVKFKTRDDYKGKKTKCPKCKLVFTIQEISTQVVSDLKENGTDGVYKCYVCGQKCPWDPVLQANYKSICERCSEDQKLKREIQISRRRSAAHNRRVGLMLIGLGLYVLGAALIIIAACLFIRNAGSMTGTTMAYALIAVLAVPCFKFGTDCLLGFV